MPSIQKEPHYFMKRRHDQTPDALTTEMKALRQQVAVLEKKEQERLRLEASLRIISERFNILSRMTSDNIYDWNIPEDEIWCSEAMQQNLILPEKVPNAWNWWVDHLHPDDREYMVSIMKYFLKSPEQYGRNEYRIRGTDDAYHYIDHRVFVLRDEKGTPLRLIGAATDMTQRRQMEEELRAQEKLLRQITDNARDIIFMMDMNLNLTFISPAVEQLSGYTVEEYKAIPAGKNMTPESYARAMRIVAEELAREKETGPDRFRSYTHEFEYYRKDGSTVWVEMRNTFMRDQDGKAIGILGFTRDITARKKAEEEKRRLQDQLLQAQKMEAIGTLAGGIAHDFNNLLMGIQGYASLMKLECEPGHPHIEKLENIEKLVRRSAELTRQLLGFARGGKYEVKTTDMNGLITQHIEIFGRTRKEISIHRMFQEDLWTVDVDRGQMGQVFLNLFVNAGQAMPTGGNLYIATANVSLDEGFAAANGIDPGDFVRISVTDTGVGMDDKTKARIFDPFFTTREIGRGTGLGLASTYGIVKNHGGMINVDSEKGQGASFHIYLPASKKSLGKEVGGPLRPVVGTETILLVDDEQINLTILNNILNKLGYQTLVVESGSEAVEIYRQRGSNIDLVILDMIMPGMGGGETFDRLKSMNPDVKVILSSGYSIDGQAQEILDRGCRAFLQKPFDINDLSQKIREVLENASG